MRSFQKLAVFLLLFFLSPVFADVSNEFAPFQTRDEVEHALKTAKVIKAKWIGTGVTNPRKLTLTDGKYEFHAAFKSMDLRKRGITKLASGSAEKDFKDSWMFEVAAYELDKLLGLNMVPVVVERRYDGTNGALVWWVQNAMSEKDRREKALTPPDPERWNQAMFKIRLFDQLVYNIDRHLGNFLITPDWKLWMLDCTRCFKNENSLRNGGEITRFSKSMIEGIKKLDEKILMERCGKWLSGYEIRAMLKRRDAIVHTYDQQLALNGEMILFP